MTLPLSIIKISGPDAEKFLQGQLTCDVTKLTTPTIAAHCNVKGRIVSLSWLFKNKLEQINLNPEESIDPDPKTFYLVTPKDNTKTAIDFLNKFAGFFKTNIEIITSLNVIGIQSNNEDTNPASIIEELNNNGIQQYIPINNQLGMIVADTSLKPSDQELTQSLKSNAITELSPEAWQLALIQNGIPLITHQNSGMFLPHDINLQNLGALNFKKGCYIGQEIIARMHYLGKLKKHLTYLTFEGKDSLDDSNLGSIVNAINVKNQWHILTIQAIKQTKK